MRARDERTTRSGMTGWSEVRAVIRREYVQRVRSRWFLFGTLAAPLIMIAVLVVPILIARNGDEAESRIVVVDATGVLAERIAPELESAGWRPEVRAWSEGVVDELTARAQEEEIGGFVVLDDATLATGDATFYSAESPSPLRRVTLGTAVSRAVLRHALERSGMDAEALLRGGDLRVEVVSDGGSVTDEPRFLVAYFGAFLLYMVILVHAVAVMRSTLEEKTSRIVEVVISAMKPWHLMLGKILGVGAVGLTQIAVWAASAVLVALSGGSALVAARAGGGDLSAFSEALPGAGQVMLFVGFFLMGHFMYSALYAAVGAMCNTHEEAQQAQLPIVFFVVAPVVMLMPVLQAPSSPMAITLSLFPLFTPVLMWARVAADAAPAPQVILSFALMALTVVGIAWVAGRVYRVGILMTGKRPTLPELWRWVREA